MLTRLNIQNFKSWQDTGPIRLASLTGLFGANSSGKTSLLQFLLRQNQTLESVDRSRILYLGDDQAYVDLGTFYDLVYEHKQPSAIHFDLEWRLPKPLRIADPERGNTPLFHDEHKRPINIVRLRYRCLWQHS